MLTLVLAALRARRAQAFILFVLAAFAGAAAAAAPGYALAATRSVATAEILAATPAERTLSVRKDLPLEGAVDDLAAALRERLDLPAFTDIGGAHLDGQARTPAGDTSSRIAHRADLCAHVLLDGACPAGVGEAVTSTRTAARLGLRVGDRLDYTSTAVAAPFQLRIVGVYRPREPYEPYWGRGLLAVTRAGETGEGAHAADDAIFVSERGLAALRASRVTATLDRVATGAAFVATDPAGLPDRVARVQYEMHLDGYELETELPALAQRVERDQRLVYVGVPVAAAQLLLLCWLALFVAVQNTGPAPRCRLAQAARLRMAAHVRARRRAERGTDARRCRPGARRRLCRGARRGRRGGTHDVSVGPGRYRARRPRRARRRADGRTPYAARPGHRPDAPGPGPARPVDRGRGRPGRGRRRPRRPLPGAQRRRRRAGPARARSARGRRGAPRHPPADAGGRRDRPSGADRGPARYRPHRRLPGAPARAAPGRGAAGRRCRAAGYGAARLGRRRPGGGRPGHPGAGRGPGAHRPGAQPRAPARRRTGRRPGGARCDGRGPGVGQHRRSRRAAGRHHAAGGRGAVAAGVRDSRCRRRAAAPAGSRADRGPRRRAAPRPDPPGGALGRYAGRRAGKPRRSARRRGDRAVRPAGPRAAYVCGGHARLRRRLPAGVVHAAGAGGRCGAAPAGRCGRRGDPAPPRPVRARRGGP